MSERAEILHDYLHMLGLRMSMRLVAAERINRMKHADGTRYSGGSNVDAGVARSMR